MRQSSDVVLGTAACSLLSKDLSHHLAVNIGEPEVAALKAEGEFFVVDSQQVEEGRVDIVDVGAVLNGVEAEFVCGSYGDSGFGAAAGEPHGERVDVMVAPCKFAVLAHGRAAEFPAPNDEGVLEKSARLQVAHQCGATLVDFSAALRKILFKGFPGAAVAVPVGVVKLHEACAPFHEPAREQAISREGGGFGIDSVEVEGGLGFARDVDELGGAGLHAIRHFIGVDPGLNFGVAGGREMLEVEGADGVNGGALVGLRDALG